MLSKLNTLCRIINCGVIAVVRAESFEEAKKIVDAIKDGGIEAIEITMTVPKALDLIEELCSNFGKDEVLIGAGTILDSETARMAIIKGAEFIVSPHFNADVIRMANRYQKVVMPGAMTVREIVECMESGADIVKYFPGNLFGPDAIKAVHGPLPQAPLCPTGGVNVENVSEWIKAGAVCVGVGGDLTKSAKTGDFMSITDAAKEYVAKVKEARR